MFALSGLHSVYGRGTIGREMERVCAPCASAGAAASGLKRVSSFYRVALSHSLARLGWLSAPPVCRGTPPPRSASRGLRRGAGVAM